MGRKRRYSARRQGWRTGKRLVLMSAMATVVMALVLTTVIPVSSTVWNDVLEIGGSVSLTPTATALPLNVEELVGDGQAHQGKKVRLAPVGDDPIPTEAPGSVPSKPLGGGAPPVATPPGPSEPVQTPVPTAAPTNTPAAQPSPKAVPTEVTDSIAPTPASAAKPQK